MNSKKILIHTCCADCLLKILSYVDTCNLLTVTCYFYNPNIHPRSEYLARLLALKEVLKSKYDSKYELIVPDMRPKEYFEKMPSNIKFPEPSIRCPVCWKLRLEKAFEYAKKNKYDAVTTTLLSSNYQDTEAITKIGNSLAKEYGIKFFVPEKIDKEMCNHGFYKQNYCGCCYSLVERLTSG